MTKLISVVVATGANNEFGFSDVTKGLPWSLSKDMTKFMQITMTAPKGKQNCVIMGKNTFFSLPVAVRPLKNRINCVVSNTMKQDEHSNVHIFKTLNEALNYANNDDNVDKIFIIGGAKLCEEGFSKCSHIFMTKIQHTFKDADVFFPEIPLLPSPFEELNDKIVQFVEIAKQQYTENNMQIVDSVYVKTNVQPSKTYDYTIYMREWFSSCCKAEDEYAYLECLKRILSTGEKVIDRTKVGTLSVFDENLKFKINMLSDGSYQIPLITTKKMFLKGAITELLWMLKGGTSAKPLQEQGVHIWDGNSTREYLDSVNLTNYEDGELGPVYGHQWINWGASDWRNKDIKTDGVNQIKYIIDTLKTDPSSRRCVLNAWNVGDLNKMALPPCHIMYIFKVTDHDKPIKTLNCKLTLRSNDMFLGCPFNIITTSILTILISKACNMNPGYITLSITDAHIYMNHIEQVTEQLTRLPFESPSIKFDKKIDSWESMLDVTFNDFVLQNYNCWGAIKGNMAV